MDSTPDVPREPPPEPSGRDTPEPEVTVIMPHFDCARYLGEAVGSILSQDLGKAPDPDGPRGLRLVLVDDCSPGKEWLGTLAPFAEDPRLVVLSTNQNVGHLRIKNAVLPGVRSPYVAFQDCDDVSLPGRLRAEVEWLRAGRADLVGCALEYIDENGRRLRLRRMPRNVNLWMHLGRSFAVLHPATTVRREVLEALNGFDGTARVGADSDFHLRAAHRYKLRNVPEVLYRYRQRSDSLTGSPETGFGSEYRALYARRQAQRERERRRARRGPALDALLRAPGNDVPVTLSPVDRARRPGARPPHGS